MRPIELPNNGIYWAEYIHLNGMLSAAPVRISEAAVSECLCRVASSNEQASWVISSAFILSVCDALSNIGYNVDYAADRFAALDEIPVCQDAEVSYYVTASNITGSNPF